MATCQARSCCDALLVRRIAAIVIEPQVDSLIA